MNKNKNKNVEWAIANNNIEIEQRILQFEKQIRGVYGFFVGNGNNEECLYIGRSYSIYARLFMGQNCHIKKIIAGQHIPKVLAAVAEGRKLYIRVIQVVEKYNDNPAKDAQRLASAECAWIDHYQNLDQCLEQYPEGKWS